MNKSKRIKRQTLWIYCTQKTIAQGSYLIESPFCGYHILSCLRYPY